MKTYAFPRARHLSVACALFVAAIAPAFAQAPPDDGALDRSFGRNGVVAADLPQNYYATSFALQSDGKIVLLAINASNGGPGLLACHLARLQSDGRPDRGFGNNGSVDLVVPTTVSGNSCGSLALQPDGKAVVTGIVDNMLMIARYNTDGTPDRSFSDDGIDIRNAGWDTDYYYPRAYGLAFQPDGKIIATLNAFDYWSGFIWTVGVRYHSNGQVDGNFGEWGGYLLARFEWTNGGAQGRQVTVLSDGKILLAAHGAYSLGGLLDQTVFARFLPDGRPDRSFGNDGVVITDTPGIGGVTSLVVQADGKFVTGHRIYRDYPTPNRGTLLRHNADGSLDSSYTRPDLDMAVDRVNLQADGRIIATNFDEYRRPAGGPIRRINPDGTIDSDFSNTKFDFGNGDAPLSDITLRPDGKPLVLSSPYGSNGFGVARLANATYCIADPFNPGRFIGFSDSGWFTTANSGVGGTGFALIGRGSIQAWNRPGVGQMHRLTASAASPAAVSRVDASVFVNGARGVGSGNVFGNGSAPARYAVVDSLINTPGCVVRPLQ